MGDFITYLHSVGEVLYVNKDITRCLGCVNASAIYSFMAQLEQDSGDGKEFSCTYKEVALFTGIGERMVASSIKLLIRNKLLTCIRKGLPSKNHYSFSSENIENLEKLLRDADNNCPRYKNSLMKQKTYVVQDLDRENAYKIGRSRNPELRLKRLMYELPNLELIMVCDSDIEQDLHKHFKPKNIVGEWFSLSEEDLDLMVMSYNFNPIKNK